MDVYTLPDLPYAVDALQPHISSQLMSLHHDKHHAAYVKGANRALEALTDAKPDEVSALERALAFNVSGHVLHSLLWMSMSPDGGGQPDGDLGNAIDESFGSFEAFRARFVAAMTTVQGSGWATLTWEPLAQRLLVAQLHDHQSNTLVGSTPVLVADAWEHAYYLDYHNDKEAWAKTFCNVADWRSAQRRFDERTMAVAHHRA
jgi:superoxide dismutase, Fe-Mn family